MKGKTDEPWRSGSNSPEWSSWVAMSLSYVKTKTKRSSFMIPLRPAVLSVMASLKQAVFKLSDYDFIGFDLDHTLVKYNLKNLLTNHFEYLTNFLNSQKNYEVPTKLSPALVDFMSRGLVIDVDRGNLLKTTADGRIVRASHGTRQMSSGEIRREYGEDMMWPLLLDVIGNGFSDWKSRAHQVYSFMDFTDVAATAVYGLAVDSGRPANQVWVDVIAGIVAMYDDPNWNDHVFSEPKYFNKTPHSVLNWLKDLKKRSKIALISSNYSNLVPKIAEIGLGPDWRLLFDFVICDAKKPKFFFEDHHFLDWNGASVDFQCEGCYVRGSMSRIEKELTKELNRRPKCLYVGDSPFGDFMFTKIDYVAVVEELNAANPSPEGHESLDFLFSSFWGPYLFEDDLPSLFGQHALNAKIVVPGLDYLAEQPMDHEFMQDECWRKAHIQRSL